MIESKCRGFNPHRPVKAGAMKRHRESISPGNIIRFNPHRPVKAGAIRERGVLSLDC